MLLMRRSCRIQGSPGHGCLRSSFSASGKSCVLYTGNNVLTVRVTVVVARRYMKVVLAAGCVLAGVALVAPAVIEWRVSSRLADLGLVGTSVELTDVSIDRLRLSNVQFDDARLGSVEIEPGLALLWSEPERIVIRDAEISADGLERVQQTLARSKRAATTSHANIELDISVRDPSPGGWTADARGRLIIGETIRLEAGRVEIALPRARYGGAELTGVALVAEASGDLDRGMVAVHGIARASRIDIGPLRLTDASVPVLLSGDSIRFGDGRADLLGGVLSSEPFELHGAAADVVLRARQLRLDGLLPRAARVTATGVVDGMLAVHYGSEGIELSHGELHATGPGVLQLADPRLRGRIAKEQSPLSVHAVLAAAVTDFRYDSLVAELQPRGSANELTLTTHGHGRKNQQELAIAINVRGARAAASQLLGGTK
jgi:hypothetical protein